MTMQNKSGDKFDRPGPGPRGGPRAANEARRKT